MIHGAAVVAKSNNRYWTVRPVQEPPPPTPEPELEDKYSFVRLWFETEDKAIYEGQYKSESWEKFNNYGEVDLSGVTS